MSQHLHPAHWACTNWCCTVAQNCEQVCRAGEAKSAKGQGDHDQASIRIE
jgi:hypothetical protein